MSRLAWLNELGEATTKLVKKSDTNTAKVVNGDIRISLSHSINKGLCFEGYITRARHNKPKDFIHFFNWAVPLGKGSCPKLPPHFVQSRACSPIRGPTASNSALGYQTINQQIHVTLTQHLHRRSSPRDIFFLCMMRAYRCQPQTLSNKEAELVESREC